MAPTHQPAKRLDLIRSHARTCERLRRLAISPLGAMLYVKRRGQDSNLRTPLQGHGFSKPALSTTQPPLQSIILKRLASIVEVGNCVAYHRISSLRDHKQRGLVARAEYKVGGELRYLQRLSVGTLAGQILLESGVYEKRLPTDLVCPGPGRAPRTGLARIGRLLPAPCACRRLLPHNGRGSACREGG